MYLKETCLGIYALLIGGLMFTQGQIHNDCSSVRCIHGTCLNGTCVCDAGWQGLKCDSCPNDDKTNTDDCNNNGPKCQGSCFCTTKGVIGNHCEKCDKQNNYFGDFRNGGTCFYDLTIDYQFTFNLSKPDDRHYNQINFKNTPTKPETDADFSITCSFPAYLNITMKTVSKPEKILLENYLCVNFKTKFSHSEYSFGTDENTTFYVYVYDFQSPMWIQIAFSQQPKFDLLHIFNSTFLKEKVAKFMLV